MGFLDKRGRQMGYRNSTLYTLKYVAEMLGEDEEFCAIARSKCSLKMVA